MYRPWAAVGPSLPRFSSSAVVLHYCLSCLDERHRDDSCPLLHMSDQFLSHTMKALYRSDLAPASVEVAEEVRFAQPLGKGVEVQVQLGEGAMSHWSFGLAH